MTNANMIQYWTTIIAILWAMSLAPASAQDTVTPDISFPDFTNCASSPACYGDAAKAIGEQLENHPELSQPAVVYRYENQAFERAVVLGDLLASRKAVKDLDVLQRVFQLTTLSFEMDEDAQIPASAYKTFLSLLKDLPAPSGDMNSSEFAKLMETHENAEYFVLSEQIDQANSAFERFMNGVAREPYLRESAPELSHVYAKITASPFWWISKLKASRIDMEMKRVMRENGDKNLSLANLRAFQWVKNREMAEALCQVGTELTFAFSEMSPARENAEIDKAIKSIVKSMNSSGVCLFDSKHPDKMTKALLASGRENIVRESISDQISFESRMIPTDQLAKLSYKKLGLYSDVLQSEIKLSDEFESLIEAEVEPAIKFLKQLTSDPSSKRNTNFQTGGIKSFIRSYADYKSFGKTHPYRTLAKAPPRRGINKKSPIKREPGESWDNFLTRMENLPAETRPKSLVMQMLENRPLHYSHWKHTPDKNQHLVNNPDLVARLVPHFIKYDHAAIIKSLAYAGDPDAAAALYPDAPKADIGIDDVPLILAASYNHAGDLEKRDQWIAIALLVHDGSRLHRDESLFKAIAKMDGHDFLISNANPIIWTQNEDGLITPPRIRFSGSHAPLYETMLQEGNPEAVGVIAFDLDRRLRRIPNGAPRPDFFLHYGINFKEISALAKACHDPDIAGHISRIAAQIPADQSGEFSVRRQSTALLKEGCIKTPMAMMKNVKRPYPFSFEVSQGAKNLIRSGYHDRLPLWIAQQENPESLYRLLRETEHGLQVKQAYNDWVSGQAED